MAADCLFCRIVRKEIPARIIAEADDCIAFHDVDPKAPVHVLVIPREHIVSLDEARDPAILGRVALLGAEVARTLGVAESGYRTVMNTNADAGQSVAHLHMHVLGGRRMVWPPG
jgi:histidine triad (HIT) family protein